MYKIGYGFDAHKFSQDSKLIIGGVEIPFEFGLKGHSDADVLSHALCDALLGALGEGDIGTYFPDSDPKYKGMSSLLFLEETINLLKERGFEIENLDSVIVCEKPKIAPHIQNIKEILAPVLGISSKSIGIKATTTDQMGFTGRGEGIAVHAVALIKTIN
ncbi:MAG: 2-C-methyl-D-erythritol 2,4-cyclodiphosphate synthase [Thermodesulfobacteriota bacterium]|nr:MAG: 2-C-methyl-D-erythritol 2,4-cyclodiphosphate synthase [Thermodesulfobacteriota bacterium]